MERKKAHPLGTILLILLAIILLAATSPFLYDLIGGFDDYDDIPSLIASDGARALSVDGDGVVSFSLDKADIYAYASRMQAEKQLLAYIQEIPYCSEKTVRFSKFGYELNDAALSASVKMKLLGFIPVQLHAVSELSLSPHEMRLRLIDVKYGRWISIPLEKCTAAFDVPELSDGFVIDISDSFGELHPLELSVEDSLVSFRCGILNDTVEGIGESGIMLAALTPIICGGNSDAVRVLRGETADVYGKIKDSASLSELLTELLKFGSEADAEITAQSLEETPFLDLEIGDVSVCASGYSASLSETLSEYETKLEILRDNYKEMNYRLAADGLHSTDGLPAEAVLPEAWGARVVLQYNQDYDSIVKSNDGSFSPGGGWTVLPNPKLSDLKRDWNVSLPNVPGIIVFDLTVALRSADGTPAILFLTALDELGFNVISEKLYGEIVASDTLPVYCSSDIISPNAYLYVTSESAQRNVRFFLP